ncbi:MAG: hypothetical protein OEQ12_04905 [Nitrosopumilus sp.]|nr:hypothetical protein [Nitrosopumilus sp.]
MNFLKEMVKKYHEKKLLEAKEKLNSHTENKDQLERQLKTIDDEQLYEVKKKIEKQKEFIAIWNKNISSIDKQLKKLKS